MDEMTPTAAASPPPMTDQERKVYDVLKRLNAITPEKGRSADDIMKAGKFPKGQMLGWIQSLEKKGLLKRLAREKAAWYYVAK